MPGRENSALRRAGASEFLHLGMERGAFHHQSGGGACRQADNPLGHTQDSVCNRAHLFKGGLGIF